MSNCRKFCTFDIKKGTENNATIYLDQIHHEEDQIILIRFFIDNEEHLYRLKIKIEQPFFVLNINEIVFELTGKVECDGIIQIESYHNNYPATYYHKNLSGNICTDHFTGG